MCWLDARCERNAKGRGIVGDGAKDDHMPSDDGEHPVRGENARCEQVVECVGGPAWEGGRGLSVEDSGP